MCNPIKSGTDALIPEEGNGQSKTATNDMQSKASMPSIFQILSWSLLTFVSKEFSVFLPVFQSEAGAKTFIPAAYEYDDENTFFDNTILTWGTDLALGIIMVYAAYNCYTSVAPESALVGLLTTQKNADIDLSLSRGLRIKSAGLFICYAVSVFTGAFAHYHFTGGVDDLNSRTFRISWILCVGTVTAAGGFMGACGSEIYKRYNLHGEPGRVRYRIAYVHDLLWFIYGGYLTWVCIQGGMSYKRPACDIFVAGTSQFLPTSYLVFTVLSVRWNDNKNILEGKCNVEGDGQYIRRKFRYMLYVGFFLNAPLLPSYPAYVQYTSFSLGVVNAIMHMNLFFAWGLQALSLPHFCQAFNLSISGVKEE